MFLGHGFLGSNQLTFYHTMAILEMLGESGFGVVCLEAFLRGHLRETFLVLFLSQRTKYNHNDKQAVQMRFWAEDDTSATVRRIGIEGTLCLKERELHLKLLVLTENGGFGGTGGST